MKTLLIPAGNKTVAAALRDAGYSPALPCGGRQSCGKCVVWVKGSFCAVSPEERALLDQAVPELPQPGFVRRLACFCRAEGAGGAVLLPNQAEPPVTAAFDTSLLSYDGEDPFSLGAVIDIGTTTISLVLLRMADAAVLATVSEMNRQSVYGADVISRIDAANRLGAAVLRDCLAEQLNRMLQGALASAGAAPASVARVTATGNTTMLHFLLGLDPRGIGVAPFTPQSLFGEEYAAARVFALLPEHALLYVPPCVSAYIGADITCGILAVRLCETGAGLLVDVGTNGEMALYAGGRLLCCATAAGPAFEGAEIAMGMPALPGAIDRVWEETGVLRWRTVEDAPPKGLCGTGLMAAAHTLLRLRAIDATGLLGYPAGLKPYKTRWRGQMAVNLGGSGILLTQQDIRRLQMAKAAIAAGIDTLLREAGLVPATLECLWLGGGFGSYIRPEEAAGIGLIPAALAQKAVSAGNAALTGAAQLLFSRAAREEAVRVAGMARELSLATHPVFAEQYMARMFFNDG